MANKFSFGSSGEMEGMEEFRHSIGLSAEEFYSIISRDSNPDVNNTPLSNPFMNTLNNSFGKEWDPVDFPPHENDVPTTPTQLVTMEDSKPMGGSGGSFRGSGGSLKGSEGNFRGSGGSLKGSGGVYQNLKNSSGTSFPQQTLGQKFLELVIKFQMDQKEKIENLFQQQKKFLTQPDQEGFNKLSKEHMQIKAQIETALNLLQQEFKKTYFSPAELQQFYWLKNALDVQLKQLELLIQELNLLVHPQNPPPCLAALVIIKQAFPVVIGKNKQLHDDDLQVQLLTSSHIRIQSITQVQAALVCDMKGKKSTTQKVLEHHIQNLDGNTGICKLPIKFLCGTKTSPATLKFGMQIYLQGSPTPFTLESPQTAPLVVITNESQWDRAAGALLKKELFSSGQTSMGWVEFANVLQQHFLIATRQDYSNPKRALSAYDLHYLHTKFFGGSPVVTAKSFDEFWEWFGKCLRELRYQKHIGAMWQTGLLFGFMDRDGESAALYQKEPGSFVIRFSERHLGQFTIAFIGTEQPARIKHYLVQPTDLTGKTLPDFLQQQPQFSTILMLTYENGMPVLVKRSKNGVLEPYCSKKPSKQIDDDYDDL